MKILRSESIENKVDVLFAIGRHGIAGGLNSELQRFQVACPQRKEVKVVFAATTFPPVYALAFQPNRLGAIQVQTQRIEGAVASDRFIKEGRTALHTWCDTHCLDRCQAKGK